MRVLRIALTATLLLFVGATVGLLIAQETSQRSTTAGVAVAGDATASAACRVDVIYFHNTQRCSACRDIEESARAVVKAEFSDELAAGSLRWSAVDMDQERHYIAQYDLAMPTLILARRIGDEVQDWMALDDTWRLIGSQFRFSMYVSDRVRAFLAGCP
jgi:hypothetical protein